MSIVYFLRTCLMVQTVNNLHEAFHVQILECHIEPALFAVDDLTASVVCIGRARERHSNLFVRTQAYAHVLLKLAAESQKTLTTHILLQNFRTVASVVCVVCANSRSV